jgi:hypothetical protein
MIIQNHNDSKLLMGECGFIRLNGIFIKEGKVCWVYTDGKILSFELFEVVGCDGDNGEIRFKENAFGF